MEKINKVMLIDDSNAVNNKNKALREQMGRFNEVVGFNNAKDAIAALKNESNKDDFSLPEIIFLDISMPEADGFDFLDKYLELDTVVQNEYKTLIAIVSDYLGFENFTKSKNYKSYGVLGHIKKPLDIDDVHDFLEEYIENQ